MSRRLVAGLVALVAVGGVFAFGLSKQDDVSTQSTRSTSSVRPSGFQTFAAARDHGLDVRRQAASRSRGCTASPSSSTSGAAGARRCKREAPDLRTFAGALDGRASIVGVAMDSPHADAVAFARKAGWRYPIVGKHCCDLDNRYGVVYLPTTIVVDGKGQVVDRLIGPQTRRAAERRAARARRLNARPRRDRPLAGRAQRRLRRRRDLVHLALRVAARAGLPLVRLGRVVLGSRRPDAARHDRDRLASCSASAPSSRPSARARARSATC